MAANRKKRRGGLSPDKFLSEQQIGKLLRYLGTGSKAGGQRAAVNEFIVIILLYTGLRAEELLSLRICDLPCYHGKDLIEVQDGKGDVSRSVVIAEWLSDTIRVFVREHRKGAKPNSILIPCEKGFRRVILRRTRMKEGKRIIKTTVERSCRMIYQSLWERLRRIGYRAQIGRLTPHMLRHTYLTNLYNEGQDLRFVQDQAGHADPKTTAIYTATMNHRRLEQVRSLKRPGDYT